MRIALEPDRYTAAVSFRVDRNRVLAAADALGLELDAGAVDSLAAFADLLFTWNRRINLTAVRNAEDLVDLHFADAFAAARFVAAGGRVADVGSGGGLPAIPLAVIRPDATFQLFEPTGKKVAFLRTAARELGLGSRVVIDGRRLEPPLPPELSSAFDVASSRATFAPGDWLVLGRRLVRPEGRVLVYVAGDGEMASGPDGQPMLEGSSAAVHYGRNRVLFAFGP